MDEADEELRQTLKKIWPLKAKKNMIDLVVPPNHGTFMLLMHAYLADKREVGAVAYLVWNWNVCLNML